MKTSEHPRDLLPWYANGTLGAGEQEKVARHLEHCEYCRHELVLLKAMRDEVKREPIQAPTELGLRRLMRDVRAERRPAAPARWRPALAAAAALVIVVQAALLASIALREPSSFVPLAGPGHDGAVLQVRFVPTVTEARIRSALQEVGGVIVDGPSAGALYRVRLEGLEPAEQERVQQALKRLSSSGVAEHVALD